MFMKKISTIAAVFALSFASNAYAGDCSVHYVRTACPGMEVESYSKCGGTKSCDKVEQTPSEAACVGAAKRACANTRLTITKSKVITATYDGKALKGPFGGSFCAAQRPDFNKCSK
jgi:hypothetical protein